MSDKHSIRNKKSLITGTVIGIVLYFFLIEIVQALVAAALGAENVTVKYVIFNVYASFVIPADFSPAARIISALSSVITLAISLEVLTYLLTKTPLGFYRYINILIQIIGLGYIIIHIFFGGMNVIYRFSENNDWVMFIDTFNLEYPYDVLVMVFITVLFLAYLNFTSRRVNKYINV